MTWIRSSTAIGTVVLLATTVTASAQVNGAGQPGEVAPPRNGAGQSTQPMDQGQLSMKDRRFVTSVALGDMMEVDLSHLATERASSEQVRMFAQRLIQDHMASSRELRSLAASKGITLPMSMMERQSEGIPGNGRQNGLRQNGGTNGARQNGTGALTDPAAPSGLNGGQNGLRQNGLRQNGAPNGVRQNGTQNGGTYQNGSRQGVNGAQNPAVPLLDEMRRNGVRQNGTQNGLRGNGTPNGIRENGTQNGLRRNGVQNGALQGVNGAQNNVLQEPGRPNGNGQSGGMVDPAAMPELDRLGLRHLAVQHREYRMLLTQHSGSEFDELWTGQQVKHHAKSVASFELAAQKAQDADVRAFAARALPMLRDHYRMARQLAALPENGARAELAPPLPPPTAVVPSPAPEPGIGFPNGARSGVQPGRTTVVEVIPVRPNGRGAMTAPPATGMYRSRVAGYRNRVNGRRAAH